MNVAKFYTSLQEKNSHRHALSNALGLVYSMLAFDNSCKIKTSFRPSKCFRFLRAAFPFLTLIAAVTTTLVVMRRTENSFSLLSQKLTLSGDSSNESPRQVAKSLINAAEARVVDGSTLGDAAEHMFTTASLVGKAASEELSTPHAPLANKKNSDAIVPLSPDIMDALKSANEVIAEATQGLLGGSEASPVAASDTSAHALSGSGSAATKGRQQQQQPPRAPRPPPVDMTPGDLEALDSADSALAGAGELLRSEGAPAAAVESAGPDAPAPAPAPGVEPGGSGDRDNSDDSPPPPPPPPPSPSEGASDSAPDSSPPPWPPPGASSADQAPSPAPSSPSSRPAPPPRPDRSAESSGRRVRRASAAELERLERSMAARRAWLLRAGSQEMARLALHPGLCAARTPLVFLRIFSRLAGGQDRLL